MTFRQYEFVKDKLKTSSNWETIAEQFNEVFKSALRGEINIDQLKLRFVIYLEY